MARAAIPIALFLAVLTALAALLRLQAIHPAHQLRLTFATILTAVIVVVVLNFVPALGDRAPGRRAAWQVRGVAISPSGCSRRANMFPTS